MLANRRLNFERFASPTLFRVGSRHSMQPGRIALQSAPRFKLFSNKKI